MPPNQREFTNSLVLQIQEINGNHVLSAKQKAKAISELSGAPREEMFDYVNTHFRTGPGLSEEMAKFVSKDRPRGAPSDSATGTKKVKNN